MISLKKVGKVDQDSIAEVLQVDKEELRGLGEKWLSTSTIAFDTCSSSIFISRGSKACICDAKKVSIHAVDLQEPSQVLCACWIPLAGAAARGRRRRDPLSVVLVGFRNGIVGAYSSHGEPLFAHKFHFIGSVRDIEKTIEAVKPGVDHEFDLSGGNLKEVFALYDKTVVVFNTAALCDELRRRLFSIDADGTKVPVVAEELMSGMWQLQDIVHVRAVISVQINDEPLGFYGCGKQPFMARFPRDSVKTTSSRNIASKLLSFAKSWIYEPPKEREYPIVSLKPQRSFLDERRECLRLKIHPTHRSLLTCDNFGRVELFDLESFLCILILKGYRDGYMEWIDGNCFILYGRRRGILEIWSTSGEKLASKRTVRGGVLGKCGDQTLLLGKSGDLFSVSWDEHSADVNLLKMSQTEVNMFFSTLTHVEDFSSALQDVQNAANIDDTSQLIVIFKAALQSFQMQRDDAFEDGSDSDSSDNESERISQTSSRINFQRELVVKKCVFQAVELFCGTKPLLETTMETLSHKLEQHPDLSIFHALFEMDEASALAAHQHLHHSFARIRTPMDLYDMFLFEWKSSDSFEFSSHVKTHSSRSLANILCPLYPSEEFTKIIAMLRIEEGEIVKLFGHFFASLPLPSLLSFPLKQFEQVLDGIVQDSFFQTFVDQISKIDNMLSCVAIICLLHTRNSTLKIIEDHFDFLYKFFQVRNVIASEHDGLDIVESVQSRSLDDLEKNWSIFRVLAKNALLSGRLPDTTYSSVAKVLSATEWESPFLFHLSSELATKRKRLELHDAIEVALDKIKSPFLKFLCFRRIWRIVHPDVKRLFSVTELADDEVEFLTEVREILRMLEGRLLMTKYEDVSRFEDKVIVGESKEYERVRMNVSMIFETHSYIMCSIMDKHCGLHDRDALSGLFPSEVLSCSLDFAEDVTVTQKEMERRKLFVVHLVQHADVVPRAELEELSKRILTKEDRVDVDLMRVCFALRKGDDELADHVITRAADPPRVAEEAFREILHRIRNVLDDMWRDPSASDALSKISEESLRYIRQETQGSGKGHLHLKVLGTARSVLACVLDTLSHASQGRIAPISLRVAEVLRVVDILSTRR